MNEVHSGFVGITLTSTPPLGKKMLQFIHQNEQLKQAELQLQTIVQKVFTSFRDGFAVKSSLDERVATLISFEDISDLPKRSQQIFNTIHSQVQSDYQSQRYLSGLYPLPGTADNTYFIPKTFLEEITKFGADFTEKFPDYFKLYSPSQEILLLEPKYQTYLDMGNVKEFAALCNDAFKDIKIFRAIALQKIANFKLMAFKTDENQLLPEVDPQEITWVRKRLFEMFQYCNDYVVRKTSLLELKDLLETDSLTSENLGEIVVLHKEMEAFLTDNAEKIQGKLIHIVIETYAKILSLILLYSPKHSEETIILREDTKKSIKDRLDQLSDFNLASDLEVEYWRRFARNCIDLLNTPLTTQDRWIQVALALAGSALQTAAAVTYNLTSLVVVLEQSYDRIKNAVIENVPMTPYWLPAVVVVNRYCQKTMSDPVNFKKIVPTLRKFKHITIKKKYNQQSVQEVRFGIILTLGRVALKTRYVAIEMEAMKLLLQYLNIKDETISYVLLKVLGRILKYRQKVELSNTVYLLLTLIDETCDEKKGTGALHGTGNLGKLKKKLAKFRENHPTIDKRTNLPFHLYLIKYFLKEHGFIDDFGGRPAGFFALSSLHSNNIKLKESHAELLRRIDQIVKISEPDVYGNTLYHAAVWNKNHEMIPAIKQSGLKIEIAAQEHEEGNTALHLAVLQQYVEAVDAFLEGNPRGLFKIKNKEGNTPLHLAACGDRAILTSLLEKGADPALVNKNGQTAIMIAIEKDLADNASILLKAMQKMNCDVIPAMHYAIEMEQRRPGLATLKTLLLIAPIDYEGALKIIMMMSDKTGKMCCTADFAQFHAFNLQNNALYASYFKSFENYPQPRVKSGQLVLEGTWPTLKPPPIISLMKKLELSEIEQFNFSDPQVVAMLNVGDEFGDTALFFAAFYPELTKFIPKMVQHGSQVNHTNYLGLSALHIAAFRGNLAAIEELHKCGADMNKESRHHSLFTPLHIAAYMLNGEAVKLLLACGADPNRQSNFGDTPFHTACLFRLEKNFRVPNVELIKKYDVTPETTPFQQSQHFTHSISTLFNELKIDPLINESHKGEQIHLLNKLVCLKKELPGSILPKIQHNKINNIDYLKEMIQIYQYLRNVQKLKNSIVALEEESKKNDLTAILDTMNVEIEYSVLSLDSIEKRLKLIHILMVFFKFSATDAAKKNYFGKNVLHLCALYSCSTAAKIICYYHPELYWKENYDQLLPIECVQNDPHKVFAIFNAMNIKFTASDWSGQNQDVEKNAYILKLANDFDIKTAMRLPLRHILAKANLIPLFERLVKLEPEKATKQDHSFFKQTSLHIAARHGHESILKTCFEVEGAESLVTQRDHFNNTACHIAILKSKFSFAKEIVRLNKDIRKAKNDDGRTPLHIAAIRGSKDMVEYLMQMGADPLDADSHGDNPLHLACMHAHVDVVVHLLAKNPALIETVDEEVRTPLHHACMMFFKGGHKLIMGLSKSDCEDHERDSLEVVKALRGKQVDLDISDASGATSLMIASANGFDETVSLLLGNDIDNCRFAKIRLQDANQRTALHWAAMGKHLKVIELLLKHDHTFYHLREPPLYTVSDINDETPLLSLTKKLTSNDDGDPVLVQIFQHFVQAGAKLREEDENGCGLLHWASFNGITSLVKFLLSPEMGADLRTHLLGKNNDGDTPLHFAAIKGHCAIATLLIDNGAKADEQNKEKITPLMLAAQNGRMALVAQLMALPIDLTLLDRQQRNFLHYLLDKKSGLDELETKLLGDAIRRNPDLIRKRDITEGNTPIHIAGRYGNADALQVVINSYPRRDILEVMYKQNDQNRDPEQEFVAAKPPGSQKFKEIWHRMKPAEIMAARPKKLHDYLRQLNPKGHPRRLRKIIRGKQVDTLDAPAQASKSSLLCCFDFACLRRLKVVVPDETED